MGTVRSWHSRDLDLHDKSMRILAGGFDYSECWVEESTADDLERLACLPGVEDDIAELRAGRAPRKAFLDVAHGGVIPEDTLPKVVTYS